MGKNEQGKEGSFLLGDPTFVDIGRGRWRCVETGQEMPQKEKESYSKSRACRVGLIDAAVAKKMPPLNAFDPHPVSKSQLICKMTGDTVNKTEEQIWKHINGRRFQNKLEKMELEANASPAAEAKKEKKKPKELVESKKSDTKNQKKDKKEKNKETYSKDNVDIVDGGDKEEESDFWMPPVGERWDFDDGKDRWESCESTHISDDSDNDSAKDADDKEDSESNELTTRTKRLAIAIGPSSFASRKKKAKKASLADPCERS
ncbi:Surfeit locus protein 2 (SURF2) [Rhynchospora pubera]|uniref:Surfeit locus protein 2 (SURF2) n=1 Tax=Rhynchospora pubera TaxID=906938 RepID=A0AAV8HA27_9POAL|nr:Surfeit locus protein 2 (SURF2) [Rhynchospora pubera]